LPPLADSLREGTSESGTTVTCCGVMSVMLSLAPSGTWPLTVMLNIKMLLVLHLWFASSNNENSKVRRKTI
jgi:hypothetical protein